MTMVNRLSWWTAYLGCHVYAQRRSAWQPAIVIKVGYRRARIKYEDTGKCAFFDFCDLHSRNPNKKGADKPEDVRHETTTA